MSDAPLTRVAVYRRNVDAPIERVWENVHDWEHLPWLHNGSFRHIALEDSGPWGWRARIGLQPAEAPDIRLELVRQEGENRYVSRTLEGPGARTEIWTTLSSDGGSTDVEVEFHVPGVAAESADAVGAGFVALYTRLWDEDEEMMIERGARLAARTAAPAAEHAPSDLSLGPESQLRATLPRIVEFGGHRFRIVSLEDGGLAVHSCVCPHWQGPLHEAEVANDEIRCPWHGYAFDLRSGRSCDGRTLRLTAPPDLRVDASGEAWLRRAPR